jgi:hypothetical protein
MLLELERALAARAGTVSGGRTADSAGEPAEGEEAGEEGGEDAPGNGATRLTGALEALDRELDARVTRLGTNARLALRKDVTAGLAGLLEGLDGVPRPPPADAEDAHAAPEPSVTPQATAAPAPPPGAAAGPPAGTLPFGLQAPPEMRSVRYVLTKVLVRRDSGPEEEADISASGTSHLRSFGFNHQAGSPPVALRALFRVPAAIQLGESTRVSLQASAKAPGISAQLALLGEVQDTSIAPVGGDLVTSSGQVDLSFVRRVGGIYAYQQLHSTATSPASPGSGPRAVPINWTDREASLELPFSWATTAPATVQIQGRAVYMPAR